MAPLALIGPAASGFSTASIVQSSLTTTASYIVKKSTGKSFSEHAYEMISNDILKQSYLPENNNIVVREYSSPSYIRFKTY